MLSQPKGTFELVEGIELGDPQPDEVLVRYTSTGLCHTDLFARDVHQPDFPAAIYGHEGPRAAGEGRAEVPLRR